MPVKTVGKRIAVIMAGGAGERFWPLSRKNKPKQLLCLTRPDKTMLAEAIDRIAPLVPPEHIYVQTTPHLLEAIRQVDIPIPAENIIAEPCKRNTAGCLCYATAHLYAKYGGEDFCMAILTADHAIGDEAAFQENINLALETAEQQEVLVTLGIKPDRPETGYGYIEVEGEPLSDGVHRVKSFKEKPSLASAETYLDAGNFYWNSGMFFWRCSVFLREFDSANPVFSRITRAMAGHFQARDTTAANHCFEELDSISIDFALMEKARNVVMIPAAFSWDDVGSLLAVERGRAKDPAGNLVEGGAILVDTKNCTVINDSGEFQKAVGIIGLDGLVVVVTDDAVLVAAKGQVEDVREVVKQLRDGKWPQT